MKKTIILLSILLSVFHLSAKDYKAGEIQSKQSFHYGRFETRFYASDVSGVLSTMFLFENDGWKDTDIWQEIDIEVFGKDPENIWQSNLIYEKNADGPTLHAEQTHTYANNSSVAEWHTYTIDWTPYYIEWFVDGQSIRKETDLEILEILGKKPMLLMFNCWAHVDPGWVGNLDVNNTPAYQFVEYVKVYDWVEGTSFEITPSFEDDFDNGLSNWNKSNHTFEGNYADFVSANVGTKNGALVLAFSNNNNTGIDAAVIPNDPLTSLNDGTTLETGLDLYPNPANNFIHLTDKVEWSLYTANGVFVTSGSSNTIDISKLSTGLYFLHTEKKQFKFEKQ